MAMPAAAAYEVAGVTFISWDNAHHQTPALVRTTSFQSCRFGSCNGQRSLRAEILSLRRPGTRETGGLWSTVERWRSHAHLREEVVVDGTTTLFKGSDAVESSRQEAMGAGVESVVHASNDSETTRFFYDELKEATVAMRKRAEKVKSVDTLLPWPTEVEGTFQPGKVADYEKSSEGESECEDSTWDHWQDLDTSRPGRLPIESNGPPMVILQPYLVPDNSQEQPKEKLKRLPLPMPHKLRPLGLPRASLRRRLGIVCSRDSMRPGQVGDFSIRDLAADIQALPVKANGSE